MPNDGKKFRAWLIEGGAKWTFCKAEMGKPRMTVREFAESHPKGRYVISIASHETACVDGGVLDAWNPAGSAVVGFFDMEGFKL